MKLNKQQIERQKYSSSITDIMTQLRSSPEAKILDQIDEIERKKYRSVITDAMDRLRSFPVAKMLDQVDDIEKQKQSVLSEYQNPSESTIVAQAQKCLDELDNQPVPDPYIEPYHPPFIPKFRSQSTLLVVQSEIKPLQATESWISMNGKNLLVGILSSLIAAAICHYY